MAFDGITVSSIVKELNDNLINGRIYKIAEPESDEILLTVKTPWGETKRLVLSACASLPLVYLTDQNKQSPLTAPNFCMLLRKHIQNGRIISITQPGLERIINIHIEHLNEMGDLCKKTLVTELMGKHSNIIFLNDDNVIIDSIKHIPCSVSSVREVLPGKDYFIPQTTDKKDPLCEDMASFSARIKEGAMPLYKALYSNYTGISPFFAQEICHRAGLDGDASTETEFDVSKLYCAFKDVTDAIKKGNFCPCIVYENNSIREYSALLLTSFAKENTVYMDSISALIEKFYAEKAVETRIKAKSSDLRRIVQTALERDIKKYDLQLKQIEDTKKKDTYRVYGELLITYGYNVPEKAKSCKVLNYYTNEEMTIPLDPDHTALENAKRYFDKYNKLKRTKEALDKLTVEVKEEIDHLESIVNSLDIATSEADLNEIKEEMARSGYIKSASGKKKNETKSKPFCYVTKEGFYIYVGKNNLQNEYITFNLANGSDWWFHAKKIPGSHVIVKTEGKELPDSVFEDAARLAAFYSKAKGLSRIEVDYVQRKEVKHPNGSKPGFVVYYTNYSMLIDSDISYLTKVE